MMGMSASTLAEAASLVELLKVATSDDTYAARLKELADERAKIDEALVASQLAAADARTEKERLVEQAAEILKRIEQAREAEALARQQQAEAEAMAVDAQRKREAAEGQINLLASERAALELERQKVAADREAVESMRREVVAELQEAQSKNAAADERMAKLKKALEV